MSAAEYGYGSAAPSSGVLGKTTQETPPFMTPQERKLLHSDLDESNTESQTLP